MSTARANPFADLSDFEPKAPAAPAPAVPAEAVERVAQDLGFPSRQPARAAKVFPETTKKPGRRRYLTGRNQQINIKATSDAIERLYKIADARHLPLGEVLKIALDALEGQGGGRTIPDERLP